MVFQGISLEESSIRGSMGFKRLLGRSRGFSDFQAVSKRLLGVLGGLQGSSSDDPWDFKTFQGVSERIQGESLKKLLSESVRRPGSNTRKNLEMNHGRNPQRNLWTNSRRIPKRILRGISRRIPKRTFGQTPKEISGESSEEYQVGCLVNPFMKFWLNS